MAAEFSELKLQDRTAVIAGPLSTYTQGIALKFTQLGGNVVLLDKSPEKAQRFAENLMDTREINERYGRATTVAADYTKPSTIQDSISRAAEAFGGIDIYVDAMMVADPKKFKDPSTIDGLGLAIDANLRAPLMATHTVLRFLEGRKRGRVIFLIHDLLRMGFEQNAVLAATRTGLIHFAKTLAREAAESHVTVNCIAMGVTEEFLLSQYSSQGLSIQKGFEVLQKSFPSAQIVDTEKIANLVAFLASPLGSGITGQTIAVSNGMSLMS